MRKTYNQYSNFAWFRHVVLLLLIVFVVQSGAQSGASDASNAKPSSLWDFLPSVDALKYAGKQITDGAATSLDSMRSELERVQNNENVKRFKELASGAAVEAQKQMGAVASASWESTNDCANVAYQNMPTGEQIAAAGSQVWNSAKESAKVVNEIVPTKVKYLVSGAVLVGGAVVAAPAVVGSVAGITGAGPVVGGWTAAAMSANAVTSGGAVVAATQAFVMGGVSGTAVVAGAGVGATSGLLLAPEEK